MSTQDSEMAATIAATRAAYEPRTITLRDGDITADVLLVPSGAGMAVQNVATTLDPLRERPRFRRGEIRTDDLESFIALTNRDKRGESVIFARRSKLGEQPGPSLCAVLDYHESNAGVRPTDLGFCKDRIIYALPLSDEWTTWAEKNGDQMDQADFAQFIEDHLFDIGEPDAAGPTAQAFASKLDLKLAGPSAMMAVSRGLEIRVNSTVRNVVNLPDGTGQFHYDETHTDGKGAPLNIPRAFHIMIPIFRGGALYSIPVRLRYRAATGKSTQWFYEMHRADLFFDDAIGDVLARVRLAPDAKADDKATPGCGLPVILGSCPTF